MRLELIGVGLGAADTPLLPTLDAVLTDDAPTVVAVGGERGPMLASLIAGGRLAPDRGRVLLDGGANDDRVRRAVALVDTPVVAEPAPALPVGAVVREELRFAGAPSRRRDVTAILDRVGLAAWHRAPIGDLASADRIRLLLELAAARPGVRALSLTSPERHGGPASDWRAIARERTHAGTPVLIIGGAGVLVDALATTPARAEGALR